MTVLLRAPEAFVAWLWQRQVGRSLCARDGQQVHVIYPGRRYGSWGPDFRGAVVTIDGRVERGDVEVHTRSGGWVQHGHGADPVYGGTVLHVVLHLDARQGAVTANGRGIPEVALADQYPAGWLRAELGRWQSGAAPVAVHACLSPAEAAELLDRAGRARIEAKSARLEADIAIVGEEQALWAGVLGALGYSANSSPFRLLADRIGVHEAEFTARCDPLLLDALLFGEAGLLPSQRGVGVGADAYARAIERAWAEARRSGPRRGLGWRWVGVRPVNHPARRVAAAAALAADVARWPLDRHVRALLTERAPGKAAAGLDALLLRTGEGDYWRAHADFARPLARPGALIGRQRAADIVVNVLLPWVGATARRSGDEALAAAATDALLAHAPLASNQITRHMASQILGPHARVVRMTAVRQQGLIAIYRGWCDARACEACPAGGGRLATG
ncbi:MAG TPA: DUF2851 family protein [Chloroflexota bacterium]|nr:DUF2851 family protein [Chloroflexota bacterium]